MIDESVAARSLGLYNARLEPAAGVSTASCAGCLAQSSEFSKCIFELKPPRPVIWQRFTSKNSCHEPPLQLRRGGHGAYAHCLGAPPFLRRLSPLPCKAAPKSPAFCFLSYSTTTPLPCMRACTCVRSTQPQEALLERPSSPPRAGPPRPSRPIARAPWDRTWREGGRARRHHI